MTKTIADINRMGKLLAPIYRERDGFGFKYQVAAIQTAIQQFRRDNRGVPLMGVKRTKNRIYGEVINTLNQLRQRTVFTVKVGEGRLEGSKPDRSKIRVDVGWMWERRVWEPFYKGKTINIQHPGIGTCLIPNHLFVLDAEEVRINHRRAKLYEALLYDMNANENVKRYIATAFVDKEMLAIGQTPAAAIRAIEEEIEEAVTKKMKGDGQ
jgi:predicted nucleotidyltransferase